MTDSLFQEPEKDGFKQESPIRAFTDFKQGAVFAVGKGFRPSLAHVNEYLNAMATKEGWHLVQVLESASGAPTFIFKREPEPTMPGAEVLMAGMNKKGRAQFKKLLEEYKDGVPVTVHMANLRALHSEDDEEPIDREKTHWKKGKWPLEVETELNKAISTAPSDRIRSFMTDEKVVGSSHFMKVASIAAMTRALDRFIPTWDLKLIDAEIPPMVFWSQEHNNFYGQVSMRGQGNDFFKTWYERRAEFPTERYPDPEVTSGPGTPPNQDTGGSKRSGDPYKKLAVMLARQGAINDPVNPKHYSGRACADIGERLSANGYQVLKYVWRLGKKDDPCVEIGKSIWYGESEMALLMMLESPFVLPITTGLTDGFLEDRLSDQPQFTKNIAQMLWAGYNVKRLGMIIEALKEQQFHLDCGRGLAI